LGGGGGEKEHEIVWQREKVIDKKIEVGLKVEKKSRGAWGRRATTGKLLLLGKKEGWQKIRGVQSKRGSVPGTTKIRLCAPPARQTLQKERGVGLSGGNGEDKRIKRWGEGGVVKKNTGKDYRWKGLLL